MAKSWVERYAETVLKWRWLVIVVTVLIIGAAAAGLKNLEFTSDYRVFFKEGNPQLEAFEALQNTYDKSDNVMFIVAPSSAQVFSPETLEAIAWLTEQSWQVPYSTRVDSITNYQHTSVVEDDLSVADLIVDPQAMSPSELEQAKVVAVNEPLLLKRLINNDASVTGVNVTIQLPGKALTEVPEVAKYVRDLATQTQAKFPNVDVKLTGIVMMNNAFGEAAETDMATLLPLMLLVVIIMLALMLRSISATFATVLVIFMSIFAAMGMFGWSGLKMTPPTASAPTIILTMAVADAVHLLVSFLWGMRHGQDKNTAMIESIRINALPIFLTSVTTILGFLTMNFSEVPPLGHLGNIVAVGVAFAFFLSVVFLPALISVLPIKVQQKKGDNGTLFESLGNFVVHKRKPLLWSMLLVSAAFIAMVPKNQINDQFVEYFDESVDFRKATDYASETLIGPYTIEFSLQSQESGGISDPAYLSAVDAFVGHLNSYASVSHVYTLVDTMKRLNKNMHADRESEYRLPDSRELAAQYLLLYEMSLPYGLDLNNQIDVDKSSTRVTMTTVNLSTNEVLELESSINQWIEANIPQYKVSAASPNLMFAHIGHRNAQSLLWGAAFALVMISFILVAALRSLKMGLISLAPNLIPAGIAFGIWAMIDGQVGMSVSIVVGMTLGIVVDDTVHFLSKYLRARREKGYDSERSVLYAFTHVGPALFVTTVVLVVGFFVLSLSTFKMNSDMGLVTALTISIALIVDFLFLPPLLMLLDKRTVKLGVENVVS